MAVVLMVWVGFLGDHHWPLVIASTSPSTPPESASRRGKAARLAKRFSALAAAVFCWYFADYAIELVDESLVQGAGQDALPLWDWLVAPRQLGGRSRRRCRRTGYPARRGLCGGLFRSDPRPASDEAYGSA